MDRIAQDPGYGQELLYRVGSACREAVGGVNKAVCGLQGLCEDVMLIRDVTCGEGVGMGSYGCFGVHKWCIGNGACKERPRMHEWGGMGQEGCTTFPCSSLPPPLPLPSFPFHSHFSLLLSLFSSLPRK